ncbi:MAG: hypothetical protein JSS36_12930, partial [Proteobacteria bacterium]|nr:hypothetical protein [Pseudomonadota bacterium]
MASGFEKCQYRKPERFSIDDLRIRWQKKLRMLGLKARHDSNEGEGISMASAALSAPGGSVIPTAEELVNRARAMIPTLKARARQAVADRDVSAET